MKTLFLTAPLTFECRETAPPDAPEGWLRVRVRHVGICGSDVHYYTEGKIGDAVVEYPHVLGHEVSGEVLDGAGHLAVGTPVYVEPALVCHECDQCRAGRENTCRNIKFLGKPLERPGCMCDEIVAPPECVIPLRAGMTLEEGLLLEPLCVGVYAVSRANLPESATVAVVGAGPIGLSVLLALSDGDAGQVFVSEPVEARRQAAAALGAATTLDPSPLAKGAHGAVQEASDGGVDVAFECAGSQEAIDDAIAMLKPGGTLMLIGIPETVDRIHLDPNALRHNEVTIVNVRRQNAAIERAMSLQERRRDFKDALITHRFAPEQAKEAFDLVHHRGKGVIKAVIAF